MNLWGLWAIILSAVTLAHIIGAAIGALVMSTKWYSKWIAKVSLDYTGEILEMYGKESENATDKVKLEKDFIEE